MRPYHKLPLASIIKHALPQAPFELTDEQIEKLKNFSDVVLGILTVATVLTMTIVAPNALQALDLFQKRTGQKKLKSREKERRVVRTFYYLKEKGWTNFQRKGNDYEIVVTESGRKKIRALNLETLAISKPAKWDGKFWQIAADVPTKKYRRGADALRQKLKDMNFYPLQRTLWFYPYDPRLEIEFITRHYGIFPFVTVMKIAELDLADERVLKNFFKKQELL